MRLHRVVLRNFRQHAATDIEFGTGITGIIGPNGAGKTTILEAIAWAFYGTPAARGNRDTIRWTGAPARATVRVEVEFTLGKHDFRVARTLYSAELFQDHAETPFIVGHQDVSARIERLLGMTRDEFFSTYFTGQKELAVMASLPPTERAQFLSRVLGYEKLRLAQDRLRDQRSALKGELTGLERGLADPETLARERQAAEEQLRVASAAMIREENARKEALETLEQLGPQWTRMVEVRESALKLDGEVRIAERDVAEARREFERLDRELAEALKAQTEVAALQDTLKDVEPLRAELERLEAESRRAGERRSLTGQLGEVDTQLARQRQRIEDMGDARTVLDAARAVLTESRDLLIKAEHADDETRTAWVRDRQDAETKRQSLRDQYVDRQKQRESVESEGPDGACPICKRPLGDVYHEVLDTLDRQREEIEVQGKFFRRRVEQLHDVPPEVREAEAALREQRAATEAAVQEVARCEDRVREYERVTQEVERLTARRNELAEQIAGLPDAYDSARHDHVRQRLRELEPAITRRAELQARASRAAALVGEAEAAERGASQREAHLRELETSLERLGYSEETYDQARDRYRAAELAVREAELRFAQVVGDRKAAEAALAAVRTRMEEREDRERRIVSVRGDVTLHDELDRALKDLRQDLNAAMRPELAERASDFLADLTGGRYSELELDEEYRVLLIEEGRAKPVISGGEEDILHLVLRLGISQMVADRAGQPLSLLVLDEVFGSLDEQRRRGVVTLLRGLADRFPQVILITHIDSVKDTLDRVLRVSLDSGRGMAVVTEEDPLVEGADAAA